jgi:hypothetical protein
MTEDEARMKLCPLTYGRTREDYSAGGIKQTISGEQRCRGSGCIMWRWAHIRNADRPQNYVEQGFCGLAGKP